MTGRVLPAVAVSLATACTSPPVESPPTPIRIAITSSTLAQALAQIANSRVPNLQATAMPAETPRFNLRALEKGSADVAFVRADAAYAAFSQGTPLHPHPHGRLRGVALMGTSILHVVVPADSPIRTLAELRAGRVGLLSIAPDPNQRMSLEGDIDFYRTVLAAVGDARPEDIELVAMNGQQLAAEIESGALVAGMFLAAHPTPVPVFNAFADSLDPRLVDLDAEATVALRARHPFYKPVVIPAHTYPGQGTPIRTLAVDFVLVCREDLPEEYVHALVRSLFDSLDSGELPSALARSLDPFIAPATPIPLHPGAARYYRERELPHY